MYYYINIVQSVDPKQLKPHLMCPKLPLNMNRPRK